MKVLIVDDDAKSRKLLADLLKVKNLEVVEAKNGKEALNFIAPDFKFCITDLRLPDIDGYEVSRQIKKKYPQLPIIAYTASALKEEMDKLMGTKLFDAILFKPVQLQDFNEVIERFLV